MGLWLEELINSYCIVLISANRYFNNINNCEVSIFTNLLVLNVTNA